MNQKEVKCHHCGKTFYINLNWVRYISAKTVSCMYCKGRIVFNTAFQKQMNEVNKSG